MRGSLSLSLCAAVGVGCLGTDAETQDQIDGLEACRGDATDAEVEDAILITEEYALGLAADIEISWNKIVFIYDFTVLWTQTVFGAAAGMPLGWTLEEGGVWRYEGATAAIELRLYDPSGAQITEAVWSIDSYLVDATFSHDDQTDLTTVEFSATGPLVDLLGLGPALESPLLLDADGRQQLLDAIGAISAEADFIAFALTDSTVLDYHWRSDRQTVAELAEAVDLRLELVAVSATREDLAQRLETVEWDVRNQVFGSRGYTAFTVTGGPFDYRGRVDFDIALAPTRDLECP
jgi:hypothetical protein